MRNSSNQNPLLQLRNQIDQIDNQIIELLNQRIKLVKSVGAYKQSVNENFFIKSAREADMIKALLPKVDKDIPRSTIVNIWRKIITSSNCLEQSLKIAIHNPSKIIDYGYLVKEYYGDFIPLTFHDSISNVIAEIEKGESQIGIFTLPNAREDKLENWWINLANNQSGLRVFAKIPFVGESRYNLVAIAKKEAEKSSEDKTLLSIEVLRDVSKHQVEEALSSNSFEFKILQSNTLEQIHNITFYLVEVEGFFDENSSQIAGLFRNETKPFVKIIGHFAKTIDI